MLTRILNMTGNTLAVLGSIASLSALIYWINGMFLINDPYAVSMAMAWFVIALFLYALAGVSFKLTPESSGA